VASCSRRRDAVSGGTCERGAARVQFCLGDSMIRGICGFFSLSDKRYRMDKWPDLRIYWLMQIGFLGLQILKHHIGFHHLQEGGIIYTIDTML
jgi:hypothetical protein